MQSPFRPFLLRTGPSSKLWVLVQGLWLITRITWRNTEFKAVLEASNRGKISGGDHVAKLFCLIRIATLALPIQRLIAIITLSQLP